MVQPGGIIFRPFYSISEMHFKDLLQIEGLPSPISSSVKFANKVLSKLRFRYNFIEVPDGFHQMSTIEQRNNFFVTAEIYAQLNIPGEWAEFGCYTGQSAMVFQKVLQAYHPEKRIYLFDSFQAQFGHKGDVKEALIQNFRNEGLNDPVLVEGYFNDTIPFKVPDRLALVHIDCGTGGEVNNHVERMLCVLNGIYDRLSKGAIVHLMDYHDPENTVKGTDGNPGTRIACEQFLKDKPEKVVTMYGNQYSHGFFIKS